MKKILIALDYNPTAKKVAEEGYSIAKAMKAQVILLHVLGDSTYYTTTDYSSIMGFNGLGLWQLLDSTEVLKEKAQKFLDKSKYHLGDETIKTMITEGKFAESILKAAEDTHASIIVMGSHSRRWLESIILGSVTEKVLNQTNIPVFIVPTKKEGN